MTSFYDKLGDLLNETLEAGEVKFVRVEKPVRAEYRAEEQTYSEGSTGSTQNEKESALENEAQKTAEDIISRIKKERLERLRAQQAEYSTHRAGTGKIYHAGEAYTTERFSPKSFSYKKRDSKVEAAYRLLEVPYTATAEDVKRAYKEKLMSVHPDHYAQTEGEQKRAATKTQEVVEAYRLLLAFLTT